MSSDTCYPCLRSVQGEGWGEGLSANCNQRWCELQPQSVEEFSETSTALKNWLLARLDKG